MVGVSLSSPDIQDAFKPGGPGLPLVTSSEGLSREQLSEQALVGIGMRLSAEAMLGALPVEAVAGAISTDGLPAPAREGLLGGLDSEARNEVIPKVYGLGGQAVAAAESAGDGEEADHKAMRLSSGPDHMTPQERARAMEIVAAHRAGQMATAA